MTLFWRESRPRGRAGLRVPESLVGNRQEHMLGTKGTNGKCFISSSRRRAGQHVCEGPTGARSRNQVSEHRQWPKRFARRGLPWGKRFSALLPARSLGFELQGKTVYSRIDQGVTLRVSSPPKGLPADYWGKVVESWGSQLTSPSVSSWSTSLLGINGSHCHGPTQNQVENRGAYLEMSTNIFGVLQAKG